MAAVAEAAMTIRMATAIFVNPDPEDEKINFGLFCLIIIAHFLLGLSMFKRLANVGPAKRYQKHFAYWHTG